MIPTVVLVDYSLLTTLLYIYMGAFFLVVSLFIAIFIPQSVFFTLQIQSKMKTVKFTDVRDFINFQRLANEFHIFFIVYPYTKGEIVVDADAASLEGLGY